MTSARRPQRQRGVALLMALLTVTLVATLATGALWQHWRGVETEAAERQRAQLGWILVGALDWARLILREDVRTSPIDHLSEPWALPLQEARLSNFLAVDTPQGDAPPDDTLQAFLSGQVIDLQGRLNLTNLIDNGQVSEPALQALERLFTLLDLPASELTVLVHQLQAARRNTSAGNTAQAFDNNRPWWPQRVAQLGGLGLSARSVQRLASFVTLLPVSTPLNLNTASAEAIHASIPGMDLAQAQMLVNQRAQAYFRSVPQALQAAGAPAPVDASRFSVGSRFFEVRGRLRLAQTVVEEVSLVERQGVDVRVLWRMRQAPSSPHSPSLQ